MRVTLSATGDAATYAWSFGDGATGAGAVVTHVYGVGSFVATVTATNETGEVAEAHVTVTAVARTVLSRTVSLEAPRSAGYDEPAVVAGSLRPAVRGARVQIYRGKTFVTSARVGANGRFRTKLLLRSPGPYHARYGAARSAARTVRLRPRLEASLLAAVPVGSRLTLRPRLVPAAAGSIDVRVLLDGRRIATRAGAVQLPTAKPGALRVELTARTRPGYAPVRRVLSAQVVLPSLAAGSRGPSVLAFEAVLAFQKVHGLPRTGRVEPWLWRRLLQAGIPRAQRGGDYIEVDKTRQVLFVVRAGRVSRVVHVSTGATGNTPLGSWRVYRKVGGWDWVLWYPLYFKGGFAIHGYPSVPAYPASHGCVRIPLWIAPSLFGMHGYGDTVVVHL